MGTGGSQERVAWIDYAKGLSIILVVNMHSTLGVEASLGVPSFAGKIVAFAAAFRMPLFFIIAGLFLYRSIKEDLVEFLDKKLVHFAYFYFLWSFIQFAVKYPVSAGNHEVTLNTLLLTPIEPFGTIWFIYVLSLFFLVTRALKNLHPVVLVSIAITFKLLKIETGWMVIDSFASQYIFFVTGYLASTFILNFATHAKNHPVVVIAGAGIFTLWNIVMMNSGWDRDPVFALVSGLSGSLAIIALCAVVAEYKLFTFIRSIGRRSLYVFLAFFAPMAVTRIVLIKTGLIPEINLFAFGVTAISVAAPLAGYVLVRNTRLSFLIVRPPLFRIKKIGAIPAAELTVAVDS